MASANGIERFQIELPPPIRSRIERLLQLAETQGRGAAFRRAVRLLFGRLRTHAPYLGNAVNATAAGQTVRHLVLPPINVAFVVYRVRRVVWIWRIDLTA